MVKKYIGNTLAYILWILFFSFWIVAQTFPRDTCEDVINNAVNQKESYFVELEANIFAFRLCWTLDIDLFTSILLILKGSIHLSSKRLLYSYFTWMSHQFCFNYYWKVLKIIMQKFNWILINLVNLNFFTWITDEKYFWMACINKPRISLNVGILECMGVSK